MTSRQLGGSLAPVPDRMGTATCALSSVPRLGVGRSRRNGRNISLGPCARAVQPEGSNNGEVVGDNILDYGMRSGERQRGRQQQPQLARRQRGRAVWFAWTSPPYRKGVPQANWNTAGSPAPLTPSVSRVLRSAFCVPSPSLSQHAYRAAFEGNADPLVEGGHATKDNRSGKCMFYNLLSGFPG